MKEPEEKIGWAVSPAAYSVTTLPEELLKNFLSKPKKSPLFLENPIHKGSESSEILKKYLQGLKYCARKKRHRCISQELGK